MSNNKLNNASNLYLEGIRDGNIRDAVYKYTGDRYTQHSTGVKDGPEGFIEFFATFLERNPVRDIQLVRKLVDGQYVFIQAYQDINNGQAKWITTDLFDTDENDKIIEHWDVIAPVSETTVSGHTQWGGESEVKDLQKTEENKSLVKEFIVEVLQKGNFARASEFISKDQFIQHNPQVADGLEGLIEYAKQLASQNMAMSYENIFKIIGQGNFVVSYCKVLMGDEEYAVFDIFRIEGGTIVEHWDNMEVIPPKEEWVNSGKF